MEDSIKPRRLFLATLWAGCIDASAVPLSAGEFEVLLQGVPTDIGKLHARWIPQVALREAARARGWEVIESVCASTNPGRAINDRFYAQLKERIRQDLDDRGPFDAAVLTTSGITKTFRIDDVEGNLLQIFQHARHEHGTTIGFFTNCHSHLYEENLRLLDLFMALKEYPHTDWADRARDL